MSKIREILMTRDGMTADEADNLISEAREQLQDYLAEGDILGAEDICSEFFGLEPDYLFELM
jgi:hypothetical protein